MVNQHYQHKVKHTYLIIYGVKDTHSDVPVDVYDLPFIFENNKMVMETDLDMNNHQY